MEDESSPKQILDDIMYRLATDKDRDVRFYISDFILEEELEQYQKKKAVEDLEIAEDTSKELTSKALPPPPTPPAHLIMLPPATEHQGISTVQQVLADLDENEEEQEKQAETHMDGMSNELDSVDSPMEIVNDNFDSESNTFEQEGREEQDQEKKMDVDEMMTDAMDISEEEEHHNQLEEHFEDDEEEDDDDHATEKKARHIYLSKTPAHALNDTNMMPPTTSAATTNTTTAATATTSSSD